VTTHIFFASLWLGGGIAIFTILIANHKPLNGYELHSINTIIDTLDSLLVIPGALGSLFTGLLLSMFTDWGFFRHHWVTTKWVATVLAAAVGGFLLMPSVKTMLYISLTMEISVVQNAVYLSNRQTALIFATLNLVLLLLLFCLSVFRPWENKRGGQGPDGCFDEDFEYSYIFHNDPFMKPHV
jgi:formate-dependent nitrite reductase membrane component NrfD